MRKAIYLGYAPISCVLNFQCPICEKTFGLKFKKMNGVLVETS